MNEKQTWIENQLNTDQYVSRIEPSQDLLHRLKAIPSQVRTSVDMIPKRFIWAAAASIALLICANILAVDTYQNNQENSASTSQIDDPYFNYLKQL